MVIASIRAMYSAIRWQLLA